MALTLNIQATLVVTTIGTLTVIGMYYIYHKQRKDKVPTVWQPIGKIKTLCMYPLKSGRRVELKTAKCTELGIESEHQLLDRSFIIYNEENKEYKTAGTHPKIILIEVTTTAPNHLVIKAPGMKPLQINISNLINKTNDYVLVWKNQRVFTIDCGDKAGQWFSKYLLGTSTGLRLGFHDGLSHHRRSLGKVFKPFKKVYPNLDNGAMGCYSYLSSYLLMNQSSFDELANRIQDPTITVNNFRPNIVVEGENIKPYAEDKWDWIKIGEVVLHRTKPCTRCSLTTVNPETGLFSANHEPLKTLKKYRKVKELSQIHLEGDDPIMGNYMKLIHAGLINIGDTVFLGTN